MKKIFGEKGILNGKRVLAATLVIVLLSGITLYSVAAGHEWKSQGNVAAVRSDGTKTVIFDKSDLDYLDGRIDAIEADVSTGKENLANALNPLGTNPSLSTPLSGTSTFNEIMEAINHSQAIPDKTIGESVSIATEDYELASKVTGQTINSDTKISAATADNLSLGTSAWVDGSLLIGTGADNKNYYNRNAGSVSLLKVATYSVSTRGNNGSNSRTINLSGCRDYQNFAIDKNIFISGSCTRIIWCQPKGSYNASTGILTLSVSILGEQDANSVGTATATVVYF